MSASRTLSTEIYLPPGIPPMKTVRRALEYMVDTYAWLEPRSYEGRGSENRGTITPGEPYMKRAITAYSRSNSFLILLGASEHHGLSVAPWFGYSGSVSCWWPSAKNARSAKWREAHVDQVVELMGLLDSPLAFAEVDAERKTDWTWRGKWGSTRESLTDYSKGLAGIFWRTFLGAPFVRLFGEEKLASVPVGTSRKLGDELWLIEPYPMPLDGLTEEGKARERAIIEHLGKECFFDHEREIPASRFAELPFVDVEALYAADERRQYEKKYGKSSPQVELAMKVREFRIWTHRNWDAGPHHLLSDVYQWALNRRNDPAILQSDPRTIFEQLRVKMEEEERSPKPNEAAETIQKTLGGDLVQALLQLGEVAADLQKAGAKSLPPEQQEQIRGVKALADLAKSGRPPRSPRRKKS